MQIVIIVRRGLARALFELYVLRSASALFRQAQDTFRRSCNVRIIGMSFAVKCQRHRLKASYEVNDQYVLYESLLGFPLCLVYIAKAASPVLKDRRLTLESFALFDDVFNSLICCLTRGRALRFLAATHDAQLVIRACATSRRFFLVARRMALCVCVCVYRLEWTRKTGERKKQTCRSAPRKSSSSLRFDAVRTGSSRPRRGRRSVSRGTYWASCSANGTVARIFAAAKVKTRPCMGNKRRCGAHATGQALS